MNSDEMKKRTKEFAKRIIKLCRKLPKNREGNLIGNQMFRSGTSTVANYRAACRARSTAEFISKLSIVEEEADETLFWMELIIEEHSEAKFSHGICPECAKKHYPEIFGDKLDQLHIFDKTRFKSQRVEAP